MTSYLFFYEGEEEGWTFEVEAKDHEEAFDKAYEMFGPQVEDMYYRVQYLNLERMNGLIMKN